MVRTNLFMNRTSKINYIHRESNYPPSIIKQLPLFIQSRFSKLSSDKNVFIQAAFTYQETLKRDGYNHKPSHNSSDKYNSNNNNNNNNNNSNNNNKCNNNNTNISALRTAYAKALKGNNNNNDNNNNTNNNKIKLNSNDKRGNNNNNIS